MPYAALLDKLIKDSGMTAKDIAQKCTELGVDVTPSYLSLLRNESRNRVASDDISIALAKVLGVREDFLVLERYMDEAPDMLKQAIYNIFRASTNMVAMMSNTELTEEQLRALDIAIKQEPFANLIASLNEADYTMSAKQIVSQSMTDDGEHITANINMIPELTVADNAMYPTIKKGDLVKIVPCEKYSDGDMLAISSEDGLICRRLQKIKSVSMLYAFDSEFPSIKLDRSIAILGKVQAVTTML